MKNRRLFTNVCFFFRRETQRYTNTAIETETVVMESDFLNGLFMSVSQIVKSFVFVLRTRHGN